MSARSLIRLPTSPAAAGNGGSFSDATSEIFSIYSVMAAETGSSLSLIALETSVEIGTPRSPRRISFASTELVKKSITFAASSLFSEVVVTLKNCDGFIKIGCCTASSSVGYITIE